MEVKARKNFLQICVLTVDVLPQPLRRLFCKTWKKKYLCDWSEKSGEQFWNGDAMHSPQIPAESSPRRKTYKDNEKTNILRGIVDHWDVTLVSNILLYSSHGFVVSNSKTAMMIKDIKKARNEVFAHLGQALVFDAELARIRHVIATFCQENGLNCPDFEQCLNKFDFNAVLEEQNEAQFDTEIRDMVLATNKILESECGSVLTELISSDNLSVSEDIVSFKVFKAFGILLRKIKISLDKHFIVRRENFQEHLLHPNFAEEFATRMTKGMSSSVLKGYDPSLQSIKGGVASMLGHFVSLLSEIMEAGDEHVQSRTSEDLGSSQDQSRESSQDQSLDSSQDHCDTSGASTPRSVVAALHCNSSSEAVLGESLCCKLKLGLHSWTPCMLLMNHFMRESNPPRDVWDDWNKVGLDLDCEEEGGTSKAEILLADSFDDFILTRRVECSEFFLNDDEPQARARKLRFRFPSVWAVDELVIRLFQGSPNLTLFGTVMEKFNDEVDGRNGWLNMASRLIAVFFGNGLHLLSVVPSCSFVVFLRLSPLTAVLFRESLLVLTTKFPKAAPQLEANMDREGIAREPFQVDLALFSSGLELGAVASKHLTTRQRELVSQFERKLAIAALALDYVFSTPQLPPSEVIGRMVRTWIISGSQDEEADAAPSWIQFVQEGPELKIGKPAESVHRPGTVKSLSAATTKTMSSYLRNIKGFTDQMRYRKPDTTITQKLALEAANMGLLTGRDVVGDKLQALVVSDYVVMVSSHDAIACYRHPILGEWKAINPQAQGTRMKMETSFVFFQDRDRCVFCGISDRERGIAEIGFGVQILEDSQQDSRYEVISVECSILGRFQLRGRTLKLEPILCKNRQGTDDDNEDPLLKCPLSLSILGQTLVHEGPVKLVNVEVEGGPSTLPIFRAMRSDPPPSEFLIPRDGEIDPICGWLQLDPHETDDHRAAFSFGALQALLAKSEAGVGWQLPELSGRWRLEEVSEYPGFSYYTILAIPFTGEDEAAGLQGCESISCMVVVLQSNDSEEFLYERIGVGRGAVKRPAISTDTATLTVTVRMVRLLFRNGGVENDLEFLEGDPSLLRISTGATLARMEPVSRPTPTVSVGLGQLSKTSSDLLLPAGTSTSPRDSLKSEASHFVMNERVMPFGQRLLEAFVPARLPWEMAIQAGDLECVLQALESGVDLWRPITLKCRLGKRNASMIPLVGAALQVGGRAALVDALFARQREELLRRGDVHTLACVAPASADAASALLELLREVPDAAGRPCPKDHALCNLGMGGNTPMQIAAMARGHADLAGQMVRAGCRHDLATAVQTGDLDWLNANQADWIGQINQRFPSSGSTVQLGDFTPLLAAVAARNLGLVQLLLAAGADIFLGRRSYLSTPIQYAQVYDQNEPQGFPIMRAILAEARRRRAAGTVPEEWAGGFLERCQFYQNLTNIAAWDMLLDFELGVGEDGEEAAAEPAAGEEQAGGDVEGRGEPEGW